jgi:ATP adenylyltransferase
MEQDVNDDRLWAPWRMEYVTRGGGTGGKSEDVEPRRWINGADRGCFLCRAAAEFAETDADAVDRRLLVVGRGSHTVAVLNRFPYNNGHVLVSPLRHVGEFAQLTASEHAECIEQIKRLVGAIEKRMNAQGFNIGLNLGTAAGAGVPGHLHWHVVPRWAGDHNFMPVVGATRVIPQSLEAVWELLREERVGRVSG